jgi:drug/metabolite transporter (DMT)-like permease
LIILFAMTRTPISIIAPARELSMMVGVLLGWWLLDDLHPGRRLIGAAMIASGVIFLMLA